MSEYLDSLIIDLKRKLPFIFFIGNGVSRLFGAKGWIDVCKELINKCDELRLYQSLSEKKGLEEFLDDPSYYPSIIGDCKRVLLENDHENIYKEVILNSMPNKPQDEIFKIIYKLSPHAIVTTNIDEQIPVFSNFRICDLVTSEIPIGDAIFYLHGVKSKFESIVFTRDDYIRHYSKRNISDFVQQLFTYSILFIGYGFEEYQILDAIGKNKNPSNANKIYRLCPVLDIYEVHTKIINRFLSNEYGIKTINYSVETGYEALYDILNKIDFQLNRDTPEMTDFETEGKLTG